jgi:DNA-directed RNA polymerase specialized sigma24 family protein
MATEGLGAGTAGKPSFEEAWPELASRLTAKLRRRASPWLTDDIVQETGLRLFKMWDSVDPELSPWGLTLTIAKNLLWDAQNRNGSRELLIELPEQPVSYNVENAGMARLELRRVGRALGQMSHKHRSVLLAELGETEVSSPSPAATKMLRMRARKRLNVLLESASASCLTAIGTARRWAFDAQQFIRRALPAVEASTSVTMAAIVGAVVVMVPGTAVTSPDQESRSALGTRPSLAMAEKGLLDDASRAEQRISEPITRSQREQPRPTRAQTDDLHHEVTFGEGVGGRAEVERKRKGSDELLKPDCGVEPRSDEIYVKCTIDSRGERYEVEATLRVKLDPDGS